MMTSGSGIDKVSFLLEANYLSASCLQNTLYTRPVRSAPCAGVTPGGAGTPSALHCITTMLRYM